MVSLKGEHGLIRKAETFETLTQQELVPPWL
jgi:hypothetical protein